MAILVAYDYSYGVGHRVSTLDGDNDPASLERKYRRVRPYSIVPASDRKTVSAGSRRVEGRPQKTMRYYD